MDQTSSGDPYGFKNRRLWQPRGIADRLARFSPTVYRNACLISVSLGVRSITYNDLNEERVEPGRNVRYEHRNN